MGAKRLRTQGQVSSAACTQSSRRERVVEIGRGPGGDAHGVVRPMGGHDPKRRALSEGGVGAAGRGGE